MRKVWIPIIAVCLFLVACSPRDFLTRRLAAALIAGSDTFKSTQEFWLRTGVISSKDYSSPEYLVLQRRGWITGANVPCSSEGQTRPSASQRASASQAEPCWDVALTPLGIETFRDLIPNNAAPSRYFGVPAARRELTGVTGVSKDGNFADVDFSWKWVPLNEVGSALYSGAVEYNSTVAFRHYDDGWRVVESSAARSNQTLEDALKNALPAQ